LLTNINYAQHSITPNIKMISPNFFASEVQMEQRLLKVLLSEFKILLLRKAMKLK
jgi:hypothetical protein